MPTVPRVSDPFRRPFRPILLAGVAALALSACASNRASMGSPDFSGQDAGQAQSTLMELAARYRQQPRDKLTAIYYAAALRANGQPDQAVAVMENGMLAHARDADVRIAYAKALAAAGRFQQALTVIDDTINPASPDWNALSVKGAILDQSGRNEEARALYRQALATAPNEASLYANLGLSYAMTNELDQAEATLRKAVQMPGATSQIRQNLALVVGLQGRFEDARALFAAELKPEQVEANMAYIRALLTQQNRWDVIKGAE
ncbi:MAG TPA: tetratricopeptide repeat protein [Alphaproteobacteria bacterium]|nr:tetratricopeptide repeat protein [Alphaproteobacteria bacterium]